MVEFKPAPPVAYGYHGTSAAAWDGINKKGFKFSTNDYDWLGNGCYFWQDAPYRALEWATEHHNDDARVVRAEILLDSMIDLLDIEWAETIREAHEAFIKRLQKEGITPPNQAGKAHRLDRAVMNFLIDRLADNNEHVKGVRGAFIEGKPLFERSAIYDRAHVQIAIRDNSVLQTMELVDLSQSDSEGGTSDD